MTEIEFALIERTLPGHSNDEEIDIVGSIEVRVGFWGSDHENPLGCFLERFGEWVAEQRMLEHFGGGARIDLSPEITVESWTLHWRLDSDLDRFILTASPDEISIDEKVLRAEREYWRYGV